MATSYSLEAFAKRMAIRAQLIVTGTSTIVRRAALAADQAVVVSTPVDTGRARNNWYTSIGSPTLRDKGEGDYDKGGAEALAQGAATIAGWKVSDGPIFIANSVPYIKRLEDGYSAQAPSGMTRFAVQAAKAEVGRWRVMGGN